MTDANHRCAVLGKPIAHSLSPALHNAAYAALGLADWQYTRQEVGQDELQPFLEGRDASWAGLSLTMPLKRTIQRYGTPSDHWSRLLRVANTAIFDWHQSSSQPSIRLYNTDVEGIVRAFAHLWATVSDAAINFGSVLPTHGSTDSQFNAEHFNWPGSGGRGARAVILGNGNTALSALAALTQLDVPGRGRVQEVAVCARHPERGKALEQLLEQTGKGVRLVAMPLNVAIEAMMNTDVVVSTLPPHAADGIAGLLQSKSGGIFDDSKIIGGVPPTLLDVAYTPHPSALLRAWAQQGGLGVGGEEMLLYQAIGQVRLMTSDYVIEQGAGGDSDKYGQALEEAMRKALQEKMGI